MKQIYTLFAVIFFLVVPFCNKAQQPFYFKRILEPFSAAFALPTHDNSALSFGGNTIVKLDTAGNIKWNRSYSFGSSLGYKTRFEDAATCFDSSFVAVGTMSYIPSYQFTGFCMRLKANGDTLWCRKLSGSTTSLIPVSVSQTSDSGFVISGTALSSYTVSGPTQHAFLAKLTKSGTISWIKTLMTTFYGTEAFVTKQTPDSGFIMLGYIRTGGTGCCMLLNKFDKTGALTWSNKFCHATIDCIAGMDLIVEPTGFLCLSNPLMLMKTDFNGNILWAKTLGSYSGFGPTYRREVRLRKTAANENLVSTNGGNYAAAVDALGNIKWEAGTILGSVDYVQFKNKSLLLIGNGTSFIPKSSDVTYDGPTSFAITDSIGTGNSLCYNKNNPSVSQPFTCSTASVSGGVVAGGSLTAMPYLTITTLTMTTDTCYRTIGLEKNKIADAGVFPNPSTGKITIQSAYLAGKKVKFEVYDISGKKIFVKEYITEKTSAETDLNELKEALYFYTISANDEPVKTGKLVIVK